MFGTSPWLKIATPKLTPTESPTPFLSDATNQRIIILGMDGYIGWSLALHLADRGHFVIGVDNFSRRKQVQEAGSWSAIPIAGIDRRMRFARSKYIDRISFYKGDLKNYDFLSSLLRSARPDTIVHLAEQPSAPYSMIDVSHAIKTQENNVLGTLNLLFAIRDHAPQAHLVKLGTMGEYGTPGIEIPEGYFDVEYKGRRTNLFFPRQPGSFYHASKVHDTHNILLACKLWNLRSTDIMQGVLYGTRTNEVDPVGAPLTRTRLDFDETFGTALNRYCAQAIAGHPLTVYGKGKQTRGFLALVDSIQCITLLSENPPESGEYRTFNQIDEAYTLAQLAEAVQKAARRRGLATTINHVENPRVEAEEHYYKVEAQKLKRIGFVPTRSLDSELDMILSDLSRFRGRILAKKSTIMPRTTWSGVKHSQVLPQISESRAS